MKCNACRLQQCSFTPLNRAEIHPAARRCCFFPPFLQSKSLRRSKEKTSSFDLEPVYDLFKCKQWTNPQTPWLSVDLVIPVALNNATPRVCGWNALHTHNANAANEKLSASTYPHHNTHKVTKATRKTDLLSAAVCFLHFPWALKHHVPIKSMRASFKKCPTCWQAKK